jgi:hypothetical protein
VREATLDVAATAGSHDVFFVGQLSRARWLPVGRYVLGVLASDGAGQKSEPRELRFTIVG